MPLQDRERRMTGWGTDTGLRKADFGYDVGGLAMCARIVRRIIFLFLFFHQSIVVLGFVTSSFW